MNKYSHSSPPLMTLNYTDILALPKEYRRNLINCLPGYQSLCLCGTISEEGQTNLSVISSVIHVGANPPLMGMLLRPPVVPRHTLSNLLETGFFTLNHVEENFYQQAHQSSANYPAELSEFDATGLEAGFSELHPAPYVAASRVQIGLSFQERYDIQANGTVLIVGRILELRVPEGSVAEDGFLDLEQCGSLSVNGLDGYVKAQRLARLAYARPQKPVQEID